MLRTDDMMLFFTNFSEYFFYYFLNARWSERKFTIPIAQRIQHKAIQPMTK